MKKLIFESDIEARLVRGVETLGGVAIKLPGDGWPDRLCVLPHGRIVWVETKRPDGAVAGLQKWRHKVLRKLGQVVEVPWTAAEVDQLLERWRT